MKSVFKMRNFLDYYYYDKDNFDGNRIWCLIRDGFKCQICSSSKDLSVHHKDGYGLAVCREQRNNHIENLITLCNKCHDLVESGQLQVEDYIDKKVLRKHYKFS